MCHINPTPIIDICQALALVHMISYSQVFENHERKV